LIAVADSPLPDRRLEVVLRCRDLDANVTFFRDELQWRIDTISPADDPAEVVLRFDGGAVRLVRDDRDVPAEFTINGDDERILHTPNGSTITVRGPDLSIPASVPSLTVVPPATGSFGTGRAGMQYRDLLPDRWGGRFIASHIRISEEGDVADWVHFHRIRFQMIFVASGWVEVVYEDQGEPFRMVAGDCVLQPPEIRHRVLRSSAGLEVIEIGCPAVHDTVADHEQSLPTGTVRPDRDFAGQRFVRHVASEAADEPWIIDGFAARDTGIGEATDGLAGAVVISAPGDTPTPHRIRQDGEFGLLVGLRGSAVLDVDGHAEVELDERSSVSLPPATTLSWRHRSGDHAALVVTLAADALRPVE